MAALGRHRVGPWAPSHRVTSTHSLSPDSSSGYSLPLPRLYPLSSLYQAVEEKRVAVTAISAELKGQKEITAATLMDKERALASMQKVP